MVLVVRDSGGGGVGGRDAAVRDSGDGGVTVTEVVG